MLKKVRELIIEWLKGRHIPHVLNEARNIISGTLMFADNVIPDRFIIDCRRDVSIVYILVSVECPQQFRSRMAEMAVYLNYRLLRGGFDYDPERGDLRYKYLIQNAALFENSDELLAEMVFLPCAMAYNYRSCFEAIAKGESILSAYNKKRD